MRTQKKSKNLDRITAKPAHRFRHTIFNLKANIKFTKTHHISYEDSRSAKHNCIDQNHV